MAWLAENSSTVLVAVLVAAAVLAAVLKLRRDRRRGHRSCGGDCAGCALRDGCHNAAEKPKPPHS